MRAQYKGHRILNPDDGALALDGWHPRDPADFSVTIDFYAGPEGTTSADAFTATVCSPGRFFRSQDGKAFSAENVIFMPRFDCAELEDYLTVRCAATEGDTWAAVAAQLTRLGRWEFDYRL